MDDYPPKTDMIQSRQSNWLKRQNQLLRTKKNAYHLNFCSSKATQSIRFAALLSIGNTTRTVLDIGCGTGEFTPYFKKKHYTGWDLNHKLINLARRRHPGYNFAVQNLEDYHGNNKWDYVFASGIFQWQDKSQPLYYKKLIRKMFDLTTIGLGFNMLSFYRDPGYKHPGELYPRPEAIFKFCQTLSRRVNLLHSYHLGDFTIHIFK